MNSIEGNNPNTWSWRKLIGGAAVLADAAATVAWTVGSLAVDVPTDSAIYAR